MKGVILSRIPRINSSKRLMLFASILCASHENELYVPRCSSFDDSDTSSTDSGTHNPTSKRLSQLHAFYPSKRSLSQTQQLAPVNTNFRNSTQSMEPARIMESMILWSATFVTYVGSPMELVSFKLRRVQSISKTSVIHVTLFLVQKHTYSPLLSNEQ